MAEEKITIEIVAPTNPLGVKFIRVVYGGFARMGYNIDKDTKKKISMLGFKIAELIGEGNYFTGLIEYDPASKKFEVVVKNIYKPVESNIKITI